MQAPVASELKMEFPCEYQFKVFGPADPARDFVTAVQRAAATVMPIPLDALRVRPSKKGTYLCVTLLARLESKAQLDGMYLALGRLPGLLYLL
ncbi:hypothetical protein JCM30471_05890 [Desulfuromonas carbonis]|uniref:YbeD family protein n=1 Tax=Desulfuromonas sp. DDH964 TaxID=1823759 RepID=UPI00078B21BB|nr:DUF493 domain-containing protein [Desulfuromonas sp. DDH964]AMV72089.1 hypothetical protein DBW_1731 [Desulfuromonas sp. DDH964]